MKKIILYGIGKRGKKYYQNILKAKSLYELVGISDKRTDLNEFDNYKIIPPEKLLEYSYDEIHITPAKAYEIKDELIQIGIAEEKLLVVESLGKPFVNQLIYEKYFLNEHEFLSEEKIELIDFIKKKQNISMFNYDFVEEYMSNKIPVTYDAECNMYYGVINDHKVYLAEGLNNEYAASKYLTEMMMEQDKDSPHRYLPLNDNNKNVIVDVGAAEGIFVINNLKYIDKAFLIEANEAWVKALEKTFEHELDRVVIVNKFASNNDSEQSITLDTLLIDVPIDIIKMDVEGAEMQVLEGAGRIIEKYKPYMNVCTYHNKNDYDLIGELLASHNYDISCSKGYILCQADWELDNDPQDIDFRRGVIYGEYRKA